MSTAWKHIAARVNAAGPEAIYNFSELDHGLPLTPPIEPYEASAALAMSLLRDYGVTTVHFVGLPPGTSALMFTFISPEVLNACDGPQAYAQAIDTSLDKLAAMLGEPEQVHRLLLGDGSKHDSATSGLNPLQCEGVL